MASCEECYFHNLGIGQYPCVQCGHDEATSLFIPRYPVACEADSVLETIRRISCRIPGKAHEGSELKSLQNENSAIRAKNAELQNENEALSAELGRLKEELDGLKQDPKILRIGQDLHDEVYMRMMASLKKSLKEDPITFAPPEESDPTDDRIRTLEIEVESQADVIHEQKERLQYMAGQLTVYREFMFREQRWDLSDQDEGGNEDV